MLARLAFLAACHLLLTYSGLMRCARTIAWFFMVVTPLSLAPVKRISYRLLSLVCFVHGCVGLATGDAGGKQDRAWAFACWLNERRADGASPFHLNVALFAAPSSRAAATPFSLHRCCRFGLVGFSCLYYAPPLPSLPATLLLLLVPATFCPLPLSPPPHALTRPSSAANAFNAASWLFTFNKTAPRLAMRHCFYLLLPARWRSSARSFSGIAPLLLRAGTYHCHAFTLLAPPLACLLCQPRLPL